MGFRDLHTFNLALLAKQGWRLMYNPDSLMAKILKAKYFPHNDIFHAQAGNNPSYTWQSILDDMEVLRMGCVWRVGG